MRVLYNFFCDTCGETQVEFWDNNDPDIADATIDCDCGSSARWQFPIPKGQLHSYSEGRALRKCAILQSRQLEKDLLKRNKFNQRRSNRRNVT